MIIDEKVNIKRIQKLFKKSAMAELMKQIGLLKENAIWLYVFGM